MSRHWYSEVDGPVHNMFSVFRKQPLFPPSVFMYHDAPPSPILASCHCPFFQFSSEIAALSIAKIFQSVHFKKSVYTT